MTARLRQTIDENKNITELFIDSEDGKTCICVLRLDRDKVVYYSYDSDITELQLQMSALVKAINHGHIEVVDVRPNKSS